MYKVMLTYENFDGNEVGETCYFHMSTKDWIKADSDKKDDGGYQRYLEKATEPNKTNPRPILEAFEDLIRRSYGVRTKTESGVEKFVKDELATIEFMASLAYDALFDKLLFEEGASDAFVKGLIPKALAKNPQPDALA